MCAPIEPADGGFTIFPVTFGNFLCACPTETAANFSTNAACGSGVTWSRSFTSTTLSSGDTLILDIDFAGATEWTIGLLDMPGHIGFPTMGGAALSTTDWNCIHVVYQFQQTGYTVYVNGRGSNPQTVSLPMTASGVELQFSGTPPSSAWVDSVQVTYQPMGSTGSGTILLSESFDDPASAANGLSAGAASVGTPPASMMLPFPCQ